MLGFELGIVVQLLDWSSYLCEVAVLKHVQTPVLFVVRFYCSNEDVEYGFNFKLSRDERINLTTLFYGSNFFFRTNIGVKSTLVN